MKKEKAKVASMGVKVLAPNSKNITIIYDCWYYEDFAINIGYCAISFR